MHEAASEVLPGGVSASIRYNKSLGFPVYFERAYGSRVRGIDGREYLDLCMSHGAAVHGHGHEKIKKAMQHVLDLGILCSYETTYHTQLAKMIVDAIPCAEMVRFALSGTEGVKYMLRIAREYTGKTRILKFEGNFHGYDDYILFNYAQPVEERRFRDADETTLEPYAQSGGIPRDIANHVVVVPYNDQAAVERAFERNKDELAGVIVEPIAWNMGCVFPDSGFLAFLRDITAENGSLLLFDEILSGFRTGLSCAQGYYGVTPDLCTLGKALSGGLPLSVCAGKREIMECLRPKGSAEHSGTFMGHITGILAAIASLKLLSEPRHFEVTYSLGQKLHDGLAGILRRLGIRGCTQGVGDRFGIYFGLETPPRNYYEVGQYDSEMTSDFAREMFSRGVYMLDAHGPKPVHHGLSSAHSDRDIDTFLDAAEESLKKVVKRQAP